jgi:hypothetical protein
MRSYNSALNGSFVSVISFQIEVFWCQVEAVNFLGMATGPDIGLTWLAAAASSLAAFGGSDGLSIAEWTMSEMNDSE